MNNKNHFLQFCEELKEKYRKNLILIKTKSGGNRLINKNDFNSIQWAVSEKIEDLK